MLKVILNAPHPITPFNEPARDLRIQNSPLWLHQRNVLAPYTTREVELNVGQRLPQQREEMVVYRDNLFFDADYLNEFITSARRKKTACRAAFSADDPAFRTPFHPLPLVLFLCLIAVVLILFAVGRPRETLIGAAIAILGVPASFIAERTLGQRAPS